MLTFVGSEMKQPDRRRALRQVSQLGTPVQTYPESWRNLGVRVSAGAVTPTWTSNANDSTRITRTFHRRDLVV